MQNPTERPAETTRRPLRHRTLRPRWLITATVLLAAMLAGCGLGGANDTFAFDIAQVEPGFPAPDAYVTYDEVERSAGDGGMPGIEPAPPMGAPTGRSVIRTGEIWIETRDSAAALQALRDLADRVDGYIATTDLRRDIDGAVTGWVTMRVPSERLDSIMADIEAIGTRVPVSRVDEFDVSTEVADVEARLTNLRAFETELLDLLAEVRERGGDAEDLVVVFERIQQVRWEIEHLEARERQLGDEVSMATVRVQLIQEGGPPSATDVQWRPSDTLATAWAATVRGLAWLGDAVIWLVLTVLPLALVILAVPAGLTWWLWRRHRARRAHQPPAPFGQTPVHHDDTDQ